METTFTVQPAKNKIYQIFRLGLSNETSKIVKKHQKILLQLEPELMIPVKISCGPPNKKTYDVNHKKLSCWIKRNNYHIYSNKSPTQLIFTLDKSTWTFIFNCKKTCP